MMPKQYFQIGQEVHIAQNHCASCKKLESDMQHPIRAIALMRYDKGFAYRIEDTAGAHYELTEPCLCTSASGHESNPCKFCGQLFG